MTTRRGFIASLLAASATPTIGWADVGNPSYIAAARIPDGTFALFGIAGDGSTRFQVPLPARGHAGAGHPHRAEAVAFARRPGSFALVIDCFTGQVLHELTPPEGRQFNGHGVFIDDGAVLVTSEQASSDSQGIIGVWDVAAGYKRMHEMPTFGIGPHDMHLMPDGQTLVIANGGIATDPSDRTKLNIPTMRPNLTYLALDGSIRDKLELEPDLSKNSIRHLALRADGRVGFAMQWQGENDMAMPLLGLHRMGEAPVLASAPLADELVMQGYAGSVAFSGANQSEIAITSPRGGRIHRFDEKGTFLGAVSRTDVCGLAPLTGGFLASDGLGGLIAVTDGKPHALARENCAWDNHIVTL